MKIKVCETFESVQGEGRYAGVPMLFIRTSGCSRACEWCDTLYHNEGEIIDIDKIIEKIKNSKLNYVCWTGGEPLLWKKEIYEVIKNTKEKQYHIESNGDLLEANDIYKFLNYFHYVAISPKEEKIAQKIYREFKDYSKLDIKVVTDLEKVGVDMIPFATMLMPLTNFTERDKEIQQKVWQHCIKYNLRYSPRLQVEVWGQKRKI